MNPIDPSLPQDPSSQPGAGELDVNKQDEERAARERETIASGDVGDATKLGITGTPPSGEFESTTDPKGGDVSANQGGTGATTDRAVGADASQANAGATTTTSNAGVDVAAGDDPDDALPPLDLAGVKSLGKQILQTALEVVRGVTLTQEEAAIAARAANVLAYTTIASIGLTDDQREHLAMRGQRAQTTLLNLAVGKSVEAQQRAKDLIVQVIRKFFSEAIAFLSGFTVLPPA